MRHEQIFRDQNYSNSHLVCKMYSHVQTHKWNGKRMTLWIIPLITWLFHSAFESQCLNCNKYIFECVEHCCISFGVVHLSSFMEGLLFVSFAWFVVSFICLFCFWGIPVFLSKKMEIAMLFRERSSPLFQDFCSQPLAFYTSLVQTCFTTNSRAVF